MRRSITAALFVALVARNGLARADEPPVFVPAPTSNPAPPLATPVAPISDAQYRSPGLAVALSLQPLPIDLGNFYAENLGWGTFYTAVEVSLLAPMMWMTGAHMDHATNDHRNWSGMEMGAMAGMISGYVAIKAISGVHAAHAARSFDQRHGTAGFGFVAPTPGGAMLAWGGDL